MNNLTGLFAAFNRVSSHRLLVLETWISSFCITFPATWLSKPVTNTTVKWLEWRVTQKLISPAREPQIQIVGLHFHSPIAIPLMSVTLFLKTHPLKQQVSPFAFNHSSVDCKAASRCGVFSSKLDFKWPCMASSLERAHFVADHPVENCLGTSR